VEYKYTVQLAALILRTVIAPRATMNFPLYYALIQTVYTVKDQRGNFVKPYLYVKSEHGILDKWEMVLDPLRKHPLFSGESLDIKAKCKFEDALKEFETANGLNDQSAGFESHPEMTPYYQLLTDIWRERKIYSDRVAAEKEKDKLTHDTCLFFESNILGNDGDGDNSLRMMKNLDEAVMYDENDELDDAISTRDERYPKPSIIIKNIVRIRSHY
jgi:hypothetical protein